MTIILSIILVLLAGCSTSYQNIYPSIPPLPVTELAPLEVLSLIKERHEGIRTLKGEGNFSLQYDGRKLNIKGIIQAKKDSFRLDIFNPFLQPVYIITYNEGVVSVLSLNEKRLYRGTIEDDNFYSSVFPFSINPSLFLSFIFGEFPSAALFEEEFLPLTEVVKGWIDKDTGLYLLEVSSEERYRYKMWIKPEQGSIVNGEIYDLTGNVISSIKMERFNIIDGNIFPKKITARYPERIVMSVDFLTVSLEEDIEDDAFILSIPPEIEEVDISNHAL